MTDYDILGVAAGADLDVVKKAWKAKVKATHPDIAGAASTAEIALINAAFDRIKKGEPDMKRTAPQSGAGSAARPAGRRPHYQDFSTGTGQGADAGSRREGRREQGAEAKNADRTGSAYSRQAAGETRYSRGGEASMRYTRAAEAAREKFRREEAEKARTSRAQPGRTARPEQTGPDRSAESDVVFNANTRKGLDDLIEAAKRREAMNRVMAERGAYPDPRSRINTDRGDLPGFHAGSRLSIKDGVLRLHVGTDMKDGRNIVAMPDLSVVGGSTLRQGREARLVEVNGKSTDKSMRLDPSTIPGAPKDFSFEIHFGDARERSRDRSEAR